MINPVARFVFWVVFLSLAVIGIASADTLKQDEEYMGQTLYCTSLQHAEEMAKALQVSDEKVVTEKQVPGVCHFHTTRFTAKKLVSSHKGEMTLNVIEVESGGETYWLITPYGFSKKGERNV